MTALILHCRFSSHSRAGRCQVANKTGVRVSSCFIGFCCSLCQSQGIIAQLNLPSEAGGWERALCEAACHHLRQEQEFKPPAESARRGSRAGRTSIRLFRFGFPVYVNTPRQTFTSNIWTKVLLLVLPLTSSAAHTRSCRSSHLIRCELIRAESHGK